jgi:menaquinone-dependent protoporphyrinogen IX oxidase
LKYVISTVKIKAFDKLLSAINSQNPEIVTKVINASLTEKDGSTGTCLHAVAAALTTSSTDADETDQQQTAEDQDEDKEELVLKMAIESSRSRSK